MSYRPYPNPAKARHQHERGELAEPPRALTPLERQMFDALTTVLSAIRRSLAAAATANRSDFTIRS